MLVILSILFLGAASALPNYGGRIVGGQDAKEGAYPYVVSLRYYGSHSCGGSILNKNIILTAAHCVFGRDNSPELFSILYGTTDVDNKVNVIQVKKVTMHPDYSQGSPYPNDVAVLELEKDIIFGDNAKPVILPKSTDKPGDDADAILVGWGYPYSGGGVMTHLQEVNITLFTDEECKKTDARYSSEVHVCAGVPEGKKGQCSGDSGGPLCVNGVQYGVVSWSVKPCAGKGHPGIFAKVSKYHDWINGFLAE